MKNWNSGIRAPDKELETKAGMLSKHKKMFSGSATQQFCAPKLGNSDRNLEGYSNPKMVRAQVTPFYALGIPSLRAESAIVIPTMYIYIICIFYIYILYMSNLLKKKLSNRLKEMLRASSWEPSESTRSRQNPAPLCAPLPPSDIWTLEMQARQRPEKTSNEQKPGILPTIIA